MTKLVSSSWVTMLVTLSLLLACACSGNDNDNNLPTKVDSGVVADGMVESDSTNCPPPWRPSIQGCLPPLDSAMPTEASAPKFCLEAKNQPKGTVKCVDSTYNAEQVSPLLEWTDATCSEVWMKTSKTSEMPNTRLQFLRSKCTGPDGKPL